MIRIRNESDLNNWFKKNYKKLGFSKIIRYDIGKFPDFIVQEGNKKMRVELEIKSSNFLLHKHPKNKVDKVVCIEKDVDLEIPIIELNNFKLISPILKSKYSMQNQIYEIFKKERVVTTSDVSKKLKINWSTAEKGLLELMAERKLIRIKKEGVNLWLIK